MFPFRSPRDRSAPVPLARPERSPAPARRGERSTTANAAAATGTAAATAPTTAPAAGTTAPTAAGTTAAGAASRRHRGLRLLRDLLLLAEEPQLPGPHPHRTPLASRLGPRRAGAFAARPQVCVSPVQRGGRSPVRAASAR